MVDAPFVDSAEDSVEICLADKEGIMLRSDWAVDRSWWTAKAGSTASQARQKCAPHSVALSAVSSPSTASFRRSAGAPERY
jgi:hypothetical protein